MKRTNKYATKIFFSLLTQFRQKHKILFWWGEGRLIPVGMVFFDKIYTRFGPSVQCHQ